MEISTEGSRYHLLVLSLFDIFKINKISAVIGTIWCFPIGKFDTFMLHFCAFIFFCVHIYVHLVFLSHNI